MRIRSGAGHLTPLFLIHAIGGNVLNYRRLAAAMPPGPPIYGLQALGLDGITRPLRSITAMAERYVREIRAVQPHGPYQLAGGSMGGMIAYEIAQQLHAAGEKVALLGLIDTPAPSPPGTPGEAPPGFWRRLCQRLGAHPPTAWPSILHRSLRGRIETRRRRRQVALARQLGVELPHSIRYAEIEAEHRVAYENYRVRPYAGSLVLFRAAGQAGARAKQPDLGWEHWAGEVSVIVIAGTHENIVESAELPRRLAEQLGTQATIATPASA